MAYYDDDDYDDARYEYDESCEEDFMDKPWIWPGFGTARPAFVRHKGVYKARRCMSDLRLAEYLEINHLNLSDEELYEIGYSVDQYDEELLALFDERTALMAILRPGSNPPSLIDVNRRIWDRLRLFVAEREGWKRAMLYNISLASGMDEDHPVYGGTGTALYEELQAALLNPDRVDKVGLQMTIQMVDPAIVAEVNDSKEFAIFKMFHCTPERPKKFTPDPEAW